MRLSLYTRMILIAMASMASGTYVSRAPARIIPFGVSLGKGFGYGSHFGRVGLGNLGYALPVMPLSYGYSYPSTFYGQGGFGGFGRYGVLNSWGGLGYGGYRGYGGYGGYRGYRGFGGFGYDDYSPFDGIDDFDF